MTASQNYSEAMIKKWGPNRAVRSEVETLCDQLGQHRWQLGLQGMGLWSSAAKWGPAVLEILRAEVAKGAIGKVQYKRRGEVAQKVHDAIVAVRAAK